jgi:hypothetical protein
VAAQLAAAGDALRGTPPTAPATAGTQPRILMEARMSPPTQSPPTGWTAWALSFFGRGPVGPSPPRQTTAMTVTDGNTAVIQIPLNGAFAHGMAFPSGSWTPAYPFQG